MAVPDPASAPEEPLRAAWLMVPLGVVAALAFRLADPPWVALIGLLAAAASVVVVASGLGGLHRAGPRAVAVVATCLAVLVLMGWYAVLRFGEPEPGLLLWVVVPIGLAPLGGALGARLLEGRPTPSREVLVLAVVGVLTPPLLVWWAVPDPEPTAAERLAAELERTGVPAYAIELDGYVPRTVAPAKVRGNDAIEHVLQGPDGTEVTVSVVRVRYPLCDAVPLCIELDGEDVVAVVAAEEPPPADLVAQVRDAGRASYADLAEQAAGQLAGQAT